MKKNTKIMLVSLSLLASAAMAMPAVSPVTVHAADQVAATTSTSAQTQNVSLAITKSGTDQPSEAAMFLGKTAQVSLENGKVSQITIHVDGANNPMTKGQDMTKMISSMSLNGVAGKQENVAKDGSSFDFVFPADAYRAGKGNLEVSLNVMGKTMNEKADVTLGEVQTAANTNDNTATSTTKKAKKAVKKSSKKVAKKAKKAKHAKKSTKKSKNSKHKKARKNVKHIRHNKRRA